MQHNSSNQKYNSNHSWDRSSYLLYLHFGVTKEISHSSDFLEVSSRIMDDDFKRWSQNITSLGHYSMKV